MGRYTHTARIPFTIRMPFDDWAQIWGADLSRHKDWEGFLQYQLFTHTRVVWEVESVRQGMGHPQEVVLRGVHQTDAGSPEEARRNEQRWHIDLCAVLESGRVRGASTSQGILMQTSPS
jgi:hypothetical protein